MAQLLIYHHNYCCIVSKILNYFDEKLFTGNVRVKNIYINFFSLIFYNIKNLIPVSGQFSLNVIPKTNTFRNFISKL